MYQVYSQVFLKQIPSLFQVRKLHTFHTLVSLEYYHSRTKTSCLLIKNMLDSIPPIRAQQNIFLSLSHFFIWNFPWMCVNSYYMNLQQNEQNHIISTKFLNFVTHFLGEEITMSWYKRFLLNKFSHNVICGGQAYVILSYCSIEVKRTK